MERDDQANRDLIDTWLAATKKQNGAWVLFRDANMHQPQGGPSDWPVHSPGGGGSR